MVLGQGYTRLDLSEIKSLLIKSIGYERADEYFNQLRELFSLKITKSEFNKFCVKIIGRKNIALHNRLIISILKNASLAKVPPPKGVKKVGLSHSATTNGYQRTCMQSLYGDAFPSPSRKGRSIRDRKFKDRPSPLGPLGKPQSMGCEESNSRAQEQQSATELLSIGSRPPVTSVEDGEEVEQLAIGSPGVQSRSPVTAPLGISINFGGVKKSVPLSGNYRKESCLSRGELPDTRSLKLRLEQKLEAEGLTVSTDSFNLLNNALDAYLKKLIEPCIGLAASKSRNRHPNNASSQFVPEFNRAFPRGFTQTTTQPVDISLLDFRVAMESNPKMMGIDWATQLEKISFRSFEG